MRHAFRVWLFLRIFVFAAAVPLLFRFKLSFARNFLERRTAGKAALRPDLETIQMISHYVTKAMTLGKPLVRQTCLVRCVTRYYFLRRTGLEVSLCFGAALENGQLTQAPGHCWLVKDGAPFLENGDPCLHFVPIYSLPESGNQRGGQNPGT